MATKRNRSNFEYGDIDPLNTRFPYTGTNTEHLIIDNENVDYSNSDQYQQMDPKNDDLILTPMGIQYNNGETGLNYSQINHPPSPHYSTNIMDRGILTNSNHHYNHVMNNSNNIENIINTSISNTPPHYINNQPPSPHYNGNVEGSIIIPSSSHYNHVMNNSNNISDQNIMNIPTSPHYINNQPPSPHYNGLGNSGNMERNIIIPTSPHYINNSGSTNIVPLSPHYNSKPPSPHYNNGSTMINSIQNIINTHPSSPHYINNQPPSPHYINNQPPSPHYNNSKPPSPHYNPPSPHGMMMGNSQVMKVVPTSPHYINNHPSSPHYNVHSVEHQQSVINQVNQNSPHYEANQNLEDILQSNVVDMELSHLILPHEAMIDNYPNTNSHIINTSNNIYPSYTHPSSPHNVIGETSVTPTSPHGIRERSISPHRNGSTSPHRSTYTHVYPSNEPSGFQSGNQESQEISGSNFNDETIRIRSNYNSNFHSLGKDNGDLLDMLESKIGNVCNNISNKNLNNVELEIQNLREELKKLEAEIEDKISKNILKPSEFNLCEKKKEKIKNLLLPSLNVYEQDVNYLQRKSSDIPCHISIVAQENAGPIHKGKPIGKIALQLICGPSFIPILSNNVQPILIEQYVSQKQKGNKKITVNHTKSNFKDNGTCTFNDLSFSSGSHPHFVPLKFKTEVEFVDVSVHNKKTKKTIESTWTKPYVSMTNNGSQWAESAGNWLKLDCFGDNVEVTVERFWNYFHKHVLLATRQDLNNPERPLTEEDFQFIVTSKIQNKKTISQNDFQKIWDWIGIGIKKIRYQKILLPLFTKGFFPAFVSKEDVENYLIEQPLGTFIVRLSSTSTEGDIVISYVQNKKSHNRIIHYLVQADDTADKKKTLADFVGNIDSFKTIVILKVNNGKRIWDPQPKDKALKGYYKKNPQKPVDLGGYHIFHVRPLDEDD